MGKHPSEGDWTAFNAAHGDRKVRTLTLRALELAGPGRGRRAVELGSGTGVDSQYLERWGWSVHSYDGDPASSGGSRHAVVDLMRAENLPETDLVLSNATLSFLPESALRRLMDLIGERLQPGGVFAADFWGSRDSWAAGPGFYPDRASLMRCLPRLAEPEIEEQEYDGMSFGGPKHWHVFTVLGRKLS